MDWLNMLKTGQETAPDAIRSFSILPENALSKLSKVPTLSADVKNHPLYCADGDCSCSTKLPANNYPGDCIRISCEHYPVTMSPDTLEATTAPPAILTPVPPGRTCYVCKGTDFWQSAVTATPHYVCRKCNPPAPGAERIK
jgi:hypothetical protein